MTVQGGRWRCQIRRPQSLATTRLPGREWIRRAEVHRQQSKLHDRAIIRAPDKGRSLLANAGVFMRALILVVALLLLVPVCAVAQVVGGCETPVAARKSEQGCYLVATHALGELPPGDVFWHIYTYPTLAQARASRTDRSTVVESHGKVWLYTIAGKEWRPPSGERKAVVGPLALGRQTAYTARYMEATIPAGVRTPVHIHSGPEAWYVLEGAQCLETPNDIIMVRAGESAVVPEGPEMMLSSVGSETRRTVLVVLHDSSKPWIVENTPWTPKGLCPK